MKCPKCGSEDIKAEVWGDNYEEIVVIVCPDRHEVEYLGMSDLREVMQWAIQRGFNFEDNKIY